MGSTHLITWFVQKYNDATHEPTMQKKIANALGEVLWRLRRGMVSDSSRRDLKVLLDFRAHPDLESDGKDLESGGLLDFADLVYHHGPRALLSKKAENPFYDRVTDDRAVEGTVQWYRDANGGDRGQEWFKEQGSVKGKHSRVVNPATMLARFKATAAIYQRVLEVQRELRQSLE
ncbi:hypothetical protein T492DRAFT_837360 [Pavlovales sp. CCMP2436]|nr:hypothetical protein T492DRAFT_837360 [Pavlovales sp. CCMP2436]